MTRIYTAAYIRKPVEQVFDYVTTAGNWPQWHPSSLDVSGATDHSGKPGEEIVEEFLVARRRGSVTWRVREREAPHRWVIDGIIEGRGHSGTITYRLTPKDGGTFFEREFIYPAPKPFFALLDWLVLRNRVKAESDEALRRLKRRLETT